MNSEQILARLYRLSPRRRRPRYWFMRRLRHKLARVVDAVANLYSWQVAVAIIAIGVWVAGHIYYYNNLTVLSFECKVARAQIEVVEQKRSHAGWTIGLLICLIMLSLQFMILYSELLGSTHDWALQLTSPLRNAVESIYAGSN